MTRRIVLAPNRNPNHGRHAWSAEQRHNLSLHNRMVRWARQFNPDTLRLLK